MWKDIGKYKSTSYGLLQTDRSKSKKWEDIRKTTDPVFLVWVQAQFLKRNEICLKNFSRTAGTVPCALSRIREILINAGYAYFSTYRSLYIFYILKSTNKMCESPRGSSTRKSRVAEQIIQKQVQTQMLAKFGEGSKEALEACLGFKKENFRKKMPKEVSPHY